MQDYAPNATWSVAFSHASVCLLLLWVTNKWSHSPLKAKGEWGANGKRKIKAREYAGDQPMWLVLVLHLIGWEDDMSFLDQSKGEVK